MSPQEKAQHHVDKIYSLLDLLVADCPDRVSEEMNDRFQQVLDSFELFRGRSEADDELNLENHRLEHNYIVAQCSVLLMFANKVATLTERDKLAVLNEQVAKLWAELQAKYDLFFCQKAPWTR